jgi:RNA polymerase sigma-70 factor (ECF subfamily)
MGPWEFTKGKEPADQRFAAFMTCHSQFVFRVVFAVLRNHADAEDAAKETFLKLYRLGGWEQAEDRKAFLARAAWRVAITRKRPKWPEPELNVAAGGKSPEQATIAADQESWAHRLIDALPDELRLPLALSTVEELSSADQESAALVLGRGSRCRGRLLNRGY